MRNSIEKWSRALSEMHVKILAQLLANGRLQAALGLRIFLLWDQNNNNTHIGLLWDLDELSEN